MRQVILATGCDEAYYPKIAPYQKSVHYFNTFAEQYLIGTGWKPPSEWGFIPLYLPMDRAQGMAGIPCTQHGAFLHALKPRDDDIIVFTDSGDVIMQRDFSELEKLELETLSPNTVMVGFNDGPHDTLGAEATRLGATVPLEEIAQLFDLSLPVFNTGVVVASGHAYRILYEKYMEIWDKVDPLFRHYAKMQWAMSHVLDTEPGLDVEWLPYSFHTHGCYPLPDTITRDDNWVIYEKGERVLFKHHLGY